MLITALRLFLTLAFFLAFAIPARIAAMPRIVSPVGHRLVTLVGDSEGDLVDQMRRCVKAGFTPVYIDVQTPDKAYLFSAYAQIVRSSSSKVLAVRAYSRVYAYDSRKVHVFLVSGSRKLLITAFPSASMPMMDERINGLPSTSSARRTICFDCIALMQSASNDRLFSLKFAGLQDVWQLQLPVASVIALNSGARPFNACTEVGRQEMRNRNVTNPCPPTGSYYTPSYLGPSEYGGAGGGEGPGRQTSIKRGQNLGTQNIIKTSFIVCNYNAEIAYVKAFFTPPSEPNYGSSYQVQLCGPPLCSNPKTVTVGTASYVIDGPFPIQDVKYNGPYTFNLNIHNGPTLQSLNVPGC